MAEVGDYEAGLNSRQVLSAQAPPPHNLKALSPEDDDKPLKEKGGGAADFVKKLYNMLEDRSVNDYVSWGFTGDSFVVKDTSHFAKFILPSHFKHSNFASFVRQLNKYDFHKVKSSEEGAPNPYGEHAWEFKHPDFRSDSLDALENIKRKNPAPRKASSSAALSRRAPPTDQVATLSDLGAIHNQIESLQRTISSLSSHFNAVTNDYRTVINELMVYQRGLVAQDELVQNIIMYLVGLEQENRGVVSSTPGSNSKQPKSFSPQAQKIISTYHELSRFTQEQTNGLNQRLSMANGQVPRPPMLPSSFGNLDFTRLSPPRQPRGTASHLSTPLQQSRSVPAPNTSATQSAGPKQNWSLPAPAPTPPQSSNAVVTTPVQRKKSANDSTSRLGPGWTVPPKVLLVEDDPLCRRVSCRFLEHFGCQIDVAEDGVSAVSKMNQSTDKYDLVLMDIMMPKMNGVAATALIRQFDPTTPIISMTSNSGPNDVITYMNHGMNDILPKPFTQEGLLGMLEKHLFHLKVMQQLSEIPRALGFTDNQIQDALAVSATNDDNSVLNPFSTMGVSDSHYLSILQGMAVEKEGKRSLEIIQDDREGKRARFQEKQ